MNEGGNGSEIVDLLVSCAGAFESADHTTIPYFIQRLGDLASPSGTPIHRIAAYFTEAFTLRAAKLWPHVYHPIPQILDREEGEDGVALRLLNEVSPVPKFLHLTLNEKLVKAFEGKDLVHIIDLNIKEGLQWPDLLQSLASRPRPPSNVKITAFGESIQQLQETRNRLVGIANSLKLHLEFNPVAERFDATTTSRLRSHHSNRRECVALNCVLRLHELLYDETGRVLMDFLYRMQNTYNPDIILVAEQEAKHNGPRWDARVANSLKHYSAIFDSLGASLPEDSQARIKIEEMFAREIRNIVAFEGNERFERHEIFRRWHGLMEESGFHCVGFQPNEVAQSRHHLMNHFQNYRIVVRGERGEALTLNWSDEPLYTVSAWVPLYSGGSST